ncbi:MAG: outer membrane beta-barrel protein [Bacteroidota bacterium]
MKKITLLVCVLCMSFIHGQDDANNTSNKLTFAKGTQFVNLNFSLNSASSDSERLVQNQIELGETESFAFGVNASYAYAINDNLFIGLGLGYSKSDQETKIDNATRQRNDNKSYQIFPYVRYYKGVGKRLTVFMQGEARYSHFENDFNSLNDGEMDNFFFGVRPGVAFMLSKNLAFETLIGAFGYRYAKGENERLNNESTTNEFLFSLNASNLFFGLNYYF